MGIRERHERERQRVRRAILDAARHLFVDEGFSNVTMRKIADRVEYSPSAIYGYFENKDDIFLQLAEEGFRLLMEPSDQTPSRDPLEHLKQHYRRYHEFACTHPEYFAVMFLERTLPTVRNHEQFAFLRDLKEQGPRLLRSCVDAGMIPDAVDIDAAARVLWAAVHGPAVIRVTWPVAAEVADALSYNVLEAVLAGLRTGIALQPIPDTTTVPEEVS